MLSEAEAKKRQRLRARELRDTLRAAGVQDSVLDRPKLTTQMCVEVEAKWMLQCIMAETDTNQDGTLDDAEFNAFCTGGSSAAVDFSRLFQLFDLGFDMTAAPKKMAGGH